ncbi:cyclopropane fatty acyl phospholipid synthase [Dongshaea marina]|uniref:cyclopropane fatty acyl phospholipid synthase n=1 Tax=Dongshaea marina TaxID=2047966 RepID=UPI0019029EA9|nr:cyclopropane fatty acyl phospholipid synthase [Dongshaea marina]
MSVLESEYQSALDSSVSLTSPQASNVVTSGMVQPVQDNWTRMATELLAKADIQINGTRPWDIIVKDQRLMKRVFQEGSLGLGESYMDGWWDCRDLSQFFTRVLTHDLDNQLPNHFRDIMRVAAARCFNMQTKKRAWIVGEEHYDIGNDLFEMMLDPYMQYSCGYWKTAEDLQQAQQNKLRLICEKLQLKPGMRLLDIGCGWGGLSEFAARHYGASVVGVTISKEQQKLAQQRCEGLDVEIRLCDYRDLNETFDRIASVGMFEHVGPKNYATYFEVASRNLRPDGLFLLHTIGSNRTGMNCDAWIDKYIFPNGVLPSVKQIAQASEEHFVMEDWHNFGPDYDRTLMAWGKRFEAAWPSLPSHYTERFYRMFRYYLYACAGAFRSRNIQLWQVLLSPKGVVGGIRVPR